MKNISLQPETLEALKEFVRTLILGLIPAVVAAIKIIQMGIDTETGSFAIQWGVAAAVLVSGALTVLQTAALKGVDKWLHQHGITTPLNLRSMDVLAENGHDKE